MKSYNKLSFRNAKRAYASCAESIEPDWHQLISTRGTPPGCEFSALRDILDDIESRYTFPLRDGQGSQFEAEIGVALHQTVDDPIMTGDPDFWRWMAFHPVRRTLLERHRAKAGFMPHSSNFGLGSRVDNFAYRAWLRADIAVNSNAHPSKRYELALRGDQDLWRSHIFRIRYAIHREMAHALVEFQYPDNSGVPVLRTGVKDDGIRLLAKRLARAQANYAISMLGKDECLHLIKHLARGLTKRDGTIFT